VAGVFKEVGIDLDGSHREGKRLRDRDTAAEVE